jgi:Fe-S-cluster containining protein
MGERRAIASKWTCSRDGTCCMGPQLVVTKAELRAMIEAKPTHVTVTYPPESPNFAVIKIPNGCPFLVRELDGKATCGIYDARPVNCRRFMCLRPDVDEEPFEHGGPMGCLNLSDRVQDSLHALTFYQANERRAMKAWGLSHGWVKA